MAKTVQKWEMAGNGSIYFILQKTKRRGFQDAPTILQMLLSAYLKERNFRVDLFSRVIFLLTFRIFLTSSNKNDKLTF